MPNHPEDDDATHADPSPILEDEEFGEDEFEEGEEPDEDAIGDGPRTILVTGACGNIGRKLRAAWEEVYDLVLVDVAPGPDDEDEVVAANLSEFAEDWMALFHGVDRPETLPDEWSRGLWLSDGDLVRLFNRAVEADLGDRSFVVVNGMSKNHGSRWDLSDSFEAIGFDPKDDSFADDTRHPGPRSLG